MRTLETLDLLTRLPRKASKARKRKPLCGNSVKCLDETTTFIMKVDVTQKGKNNLGFFVTNLHAPS